MRIYSGTLFKILNNFTAPSGMFCTPDSHRANVLGETSTCRAAFASDKPRDFRKAFSSKPSMPYPSMPNNTDAGLTGPHHTAPDQTPTRRSRPRPTRFAAAAHSFEWAGTALPYRTLPVLTKPQPILPNQTQTCRTKSNRTQPCHYVNTSNRTTLKRPYVGRKSPTPTSRPDMLITSFRNAGSMYSGVRT